MIANRITPACPYILPSARRRSGMVARQVRRSVVMSNLQIRLLPMDSDRTPLEKGKDVLHGAARAAPLRQSVEQPCLYPLPHHPPLRSGFRLATGRVGLTLLPEGEVRPGRLRPFVRRELVSPSPVEQSGDPTR